MPAQKSAALKTHFGGLYAHALGRFAIERIVPALFLWMPGVETRPRFMATDDIALSRLLLQASTQHLRLTIEDLPVGTITVNDIGVIERADSVTAALVCGLGGDLRGLTLDQVLCSDNVDVIDLVKSKKFGYIGKLALRRDDGANLSVDVVMYPNANPLKTDVAINFNADAG